MAAHDGAHYGHGSASSSSSSSAGSSAEGRARVAAGAAGWSVQNGGASTSAGGQGLPAHVRLPQPGIPRRVSYTLPLPGYTVSQPPVRPLRVFALPPAPLAGEHRPDPSPVLTPSNQHRPSDFGLEALGCGQTDRHPRHTLPITSLAIDTSTRIQQGQHPSAACPEGILYTGGRDGLVCSWELGIPMREVVSPPRKKRRRALFSKGLDEDADEEDEDDPDEHTTGALPIGIEGVGLGTASSYARPPMKLMVRKDSARARKTTTWEADHDQIPGILGKRRTRFRQCLQSHTDWINDIILCNQNQTLISASSDRTVKIWNPHDEATALLPSTFGSHSDYVRCLSHAPQANAVISGGLDRTVKVWDLGLASTSSGRGVHSSDKPIWELSEQAIGQSVYALATTPAATVIAVGTPARSVRLWDPRAQPNASPIANLIGHTDNVRALLLSADGKHLLSGSSDSTIRLWSIGEQRCLHTFTHHNDSVWSLFSTDENLDVFYSGDRQGFLCKVDLEGCGDLSDGECVVLARDNDQSSTVAGAGGIQKIVALPNAFVWTASGSSSVQMWRDIPSRQDRGARDEIGNEMPDFVVNKRFNLMDSAPPSGTASFRRRYADSPSSSPRSTAAALPSGSPTSPKGMEMEQAANGVHQKRSISTTAAADWQLPDIPDSMTRNAVPYESLLSLAPVNDPYGAAVGLGSSSVRDLPGALGRGSLSFMNASRSSFAQFGRGPSISMDSAAQTGQGHALTLAPTRSRSILEGYTSPQNVGSPVPAAAQPSSSGNHVSFSPKDPWKDPLKKERSGSVIRFAQHVDTNDLTGAVPEQAIDTSGDGDGVAEAPSDAAVEARLAYEDRELAEDATPLREKPSEVIEGAHGLIRCTMLNDRRHVLTVDSKGWLAVWDILSAQMIGIFDPADIRAAAINDEACVAAITEKGRAASSQSFPIQSIPAEILELVKGRVEGEGISAPWCTVDVKIGALTVHLEEPRCFDAEIYLDECSEFVDSALCQDDRRINMGKWVLRNLFDQFINAEIKMRVHEKATLLTGVPAFENDALFSRAPARTLLLTRADANGHAVYTPGFTIPLATTARTPVLNKAVPDQNLVTQPLRTPGADQTPLAQGAAVDYFSITGSTTPGSQGENSGTQTPVEVVNNEAATPVISQSRWTSLSLGGNKNSLALNTTTSLGRGGTISGASDGSAGTPMTPSTPTGGFMGRLRGLGKNSKDKGAKAAETEKTETKDSKDDQAESSDPRNAAHVAALRQLLARPLSITGFEDFPTLKFDPEMSVMISEAIPDTGSWEVVYRGVIGCTGCDVSILELISPVWLLEFTLASRVLAREQGSNKLSFTLHPWVDPEASKTAGWKPGQDAMPPLPSGNVRLSATRMLRMRKVSMYVCEKLDLMPARKHQDSIAGSVRSNNEGGANAGRQGAGLNMTALSNPNTAGAAASSTSLNSQGASTTNEDAAEQEQARLEFAKSIEILHGNIVLKPEMTLAQCQRFYHRAGGDIRLEYRQRAQAA
ncbi:hypothetical protein OC845_006343 [Tilletia horrida]|nr:hypothetical protein OC845_006343 [Tilletia horrida]